MSFLRGSANYVWCTTSVLGKGATGAVFQGVNKNNGEPVAVKTFNQLSQMRPHDVQLREFEVLRRVNHENIVKLLAIEEEQEGRGKVIVMELCTGGSLFNLLDDPENSQGLQEDEFLLVLEHVAAGMKHLRDLSLVHRDLKPGNIMKFVREDGQAVYKLTDFGAARELAEDQQFMSLYGTEEYLHPDLYERAVLRKPVGKSFGATVDLWSIGVTLYHVATGNLPFRPFGGRRNKETMFYITTKKASGVISGIQTADGGPIDWSTCLPSHCHLSIGAQKLITPLLAGLLEVDSSRIWTFERFFSEVTSILSRKLIHVFHVHRLSSIRVYLGPDEGLDVLQELITEQTSVPINSQLLLLNDSEFYKLIQPDTTAKGFPITTEQSPILLFSKENNNVQLDDTADIQRFPVFQNVISVENDAAIGKQSCSVGHICKRRIDKLAKGSLLAHHAVQVLSSVISNELQRIWLHVQQLQQVQRLVLRLKCCLEEIETAVGLLQGQPSSEDHFNINAQMNALSQQMIELVPAVRQVHQRICTESIGQNHLCIEWNGAVVGSGLRCPTKERAPERARTLVDRLRDSWQHLLRDRATRSLTYNDEQFHVLERIKVGETGKRLRGLLESECMPHMTMLADVFADWYKVAQTLYLQTTILGKDAASGARKLDTLSTLLSELTQNGLSALHRATETARSVKLPGQQTDMSVISALQHCTLLDNQIMQLLEKNQALWEEFRSVVR